MVEEDIISFVYLTVVTFICKSWNNPFRPTDNSAWPTSVLYHTVLIQEMSENVRNTRIIHVRHHFYKYCTCYNIHVCTYYMYSLYQKYLAM